MNKLKAMLCAVFTLMLVNISTTANSDSGNFAGPYVGFSAISAGVELDGSSSSTGSATEGSSSAVHTDQVKGGAAALATGVEAGYAIPLGSSLLLDIGVSYLAGKASVKAETNDPLARGNVSFIVDKFITGYIAPTIVLSDTSSFYVKLGLTEADTDVTGDITQPANLSGTTWGIGTRTQLSSGIFIRTEAGYTEYNGIGSRGKGTTATGQAINTTTTYTADPTVAYGRVTLGFRF